MVLLFPTWQHNHSVINVFHLLPFFVWGFSATSRTSIPCSRTTRLCPWSCARCSCGWSRHSACYCRGSSAIMPWIVACYVAKVSYIIGGAICIQPPYAEKHRQRCHLTYIYIHVHVWFCLGINRKMSIQKVVPVNHHQEHIYQALMFPFAHDNLSGQSPYHFDVEGRRYRCFCGYAATGSGTWCWEGWVTRVWCHNNACWG